MKRAIAAIVIVTTTWMLSGCGGPPADASKKEFCDQLQQVNGEKSWKDTKASVAKLEEVGTPEGISEDARAGFVELVGYTKAAKNREALVAKIEKLDKSERQHLDAFDGFVTKACPTGS